jgi:hypothetical protein
LLQQREELANGVGSKTGRNAQDAPAPKNEFERSRSESGLLRQSQGQEEGWVGGGRRVPWGSGRGRALRERASPEIEGGFRERVLPTIGADGESGTRLLLEVLLPGLLFVAVTLVLGHDSSPETGKKHANDTVYEKDE